MESFSGVPLAAFSFEVASESIVATLMVRRFPSLVT